MSQISLVSPFKFSQRLDHKQWKTVRFRYLGDLAVFCMNALVQEVAPCWRRHDPKGLAQRQHDRNVLQIPMKEHHERYGITGNCFDLAIWLLHEFKKEGIEAYPIGHDLGTTEAHVAVVPKNEDGRRYLCDLGDQWLIPVLVDADHPSFTSERLTGFFPAAEIEVQPHQDTVTILYHRPNGKMSSQKFDLVPLELSSFWKAAEISQNTIKKSPLPGDSNLITNLKRIPWQQRSEEPSTRGMDLLSIT